MTEVESQLSIIRITATGKQNQRKLRKQAAIFFNTTLKQETIEQLQYILLKVHIKNEQLKSMTPPRNK